MPNIARFAHSPLRRTLLAALSAAALAPHVQGQPAFDAVDPASVELSDKPLSLEAIGLRLFPPTDSTSFTQTVAGWITSTIQLPGEIGSIGVQRRTTTDDVPLVEIEAGVLKSTLGLPEETTGVSIDADLDTPQGRSLGRSPAIPAAGRVVRPFYVHLNEVKDQPFRGFAVLKMTATDFVLLQLSATEKGFEQARKDFEAMIASAQLISPDSLDAQRGSEVRAGVAALEGLSPEAYDAVVADSPNQFERIYRPAPGGAEADEKEMGYRRVRAWMGSRNDLSTGEPSKDAKPDGYLLRIDGLVLLDDGRRADSKSVYFLSRDRRQEAWTMTMAIRGSGAAKPEVWSELGARSGSSMSVQVNQGGRSSHTLRPSIEGPGYISQLESYLLPQLLIRAGKPGKYAFYAYDQSAESNRLKTVELGRVDDRPGLWRTTTRRVDEQFETADFNEYGRLIRSESSDGLIKRPIEFDRLYRIWESKGLPLD